MHLIIAMTEANLDHFGAEARRAAADPDYAPFHPTLLATHCLLETMDRLLNGAVSPGRGRDTVQGNDTAAAIAADDALILCDAPEAAARLSAEGFPVVGYFHAGNGDAHFRGVPYVLSQIDEIDPDTYVKICQRLHHLPWTILTTPRCVVREMTTADLPGLYRLYDDPAARRFLEAPGPDQQKEKEILQAYIDRVYGLYGYGYWAVTERAPTNVGQADVPGPETPASDSPFTKTVNSSSAAQPQHPGRSIDQPDDLIGRVGFEPYQAHARSVSFGYLIRADHRRQGLAEEVCRAVLTYAGQNLDFPSITAEVASDNIPSLHLLQKLGFAFEKMQDNHQIWRYH